MLQRATLPLMMHLCIPWPAHKNREKSLALLRRGLLAVASVHTRKALNKSLFHGLFLLTCLLDIYQRLGGCLSVGNGFGRNTFENIAE
ncbi:hypothetical protein EJB05_51972 [Eragrostis curvula]|uniref:Uncharacterized protein n=1 Tax=Eragrostis curvula TaxID=38414 RepID=A0A5J9SU25_9POAL|nr:hypothetical protein EJB05_51933 [Eragrostis curvula]TVU02562.1 hypothetical protein EJB05_51972 [Eragrostis curvula]